MLINTVPIKWLCSDVTAEGVNEQSIILVKLNISDEVCHHWVLVLIQGNTVLSHVILIVTIITSPVMQEEEQEIELTEFEENIKGNLMEEEALSVNSIDNIVPAWWLSEPFK